MASISTDKRGNRRILFVDRDGRRKPIRVGKLPLKQTEVIKRRIEHIVASRLAGTGLDPETAQWIAKMPDDLSAKLAAVGLIERRGCSLLGEFVAEYINSRKADAQESTIKNLRQAERYAVEFFGANKRLRDVTLGDADDFRRWLSTKIGDNTARRLLSRVKQFFRAAMRKRLVPDNPFGDMKGLGVLANRDREFFVTRDVAAKVLAACPDNEWRLLFVLARFGGLRTVSEPLALTWGDVDWERNRLRVTSVKTACHEGHGERWIPLFPELRPYLEAAFNEAGPGTYVITRHRNVNFRRRFKNIIRAAGLTPWPKAFQNLRSTRETELAETYPIHVVCSWLGNSPTVARKHYLQVTDAHFEKAAQKAAHSPAADANQGSSESNENTVLQAIG